MDYRKRRRYGTEGLRSPADLRRCSFLRLFTPALLNCSQEVRFAWVNDVLGGGEAHLASLSAKKYNGRTSVFIGGGLILDSKQIEVWPPALIESDYFSVNNLNSSDAE